MKKELFIQRAAIGPVRIHQPDMSPEPIFAVFVFRILLQEHCPARNGIKEGLFRFSKPAFRRVLGDFRFWGVDADEAHYHAFAIEIDD